MPRAEVIIDARPYYVIRVTCSAGREFDQTIYCDMGGDELMAFLQAYADDYEAGLPPPEGE